MKLLFAGGGTGGHVFTALALAREFKRRGAGHDVAFVGTEKGLEMRLVPEAGFKLHTIPVRGLKRVGLKGKILGVASLPQSFVAALRVLIAEKPNFVFGVGGYASGPVVLLAALLGIPTAIIEQNSIPGLTNRLLGRWAKTIFLAFDHARRFFPSYKCMTTGNAIREDLIPQFVAVKKQTDRLNMLIFGGSQGAQRIDQAMIESLPLLKDMAPKLRFVHQCSADSLAGLEKAYREYGFEAEVRRFIDDMGAAYGRADVVVSRSGALSLAEIATLGKPAVLIPYPFAADNHQEENARAFHEKKAAVLLLDQDLKGFAIAEIVRDFLLHPQRLETLSRNVQAFSCARSASKIIDQCEIMMRPKGAPAPLAPEVVSHAR